jgi:hypothetical protein
MRVGGGGAASASACVMLLEMESTVRGGTWEEDGKFFLRGELWNLLEMSFFTEHQSVESHNPLPCFSACGVGVSWREPKCRCVDTAAQH